MRDKVELIFQSSRPWSAPSKVIQLLEILREYEAVGLSPDRCGLDERRTFALVNLPEAEVKRVWEQARRGTFKRKAPWNLQVSVQYELSPPLMSNLWLWLDAAFFQDEGRLHEFLRLCKELYEWGNIDHGYVCHVEEYEQKNSFGPGRGVGGAKLETCLPGIYWANLFGPIYVEWFGEEKFETLETFHKKQLSDGGWLLVTRPSVIEYDAPSLRVHERQIIAHLGREAFFEMEDPDKPTKAPGFWET